MEPFGLVAGGHYLHNAYHLARMCELAYDDDPAGASLELSDAFDRIEPFDTGETEGFVAANDGHVVLTFRGTDEPLDWLNNLNFSQIDGFGGRVHEGFALALDETWTTAWRKIQRFHTDQPVWITGHSLGGALASLAAKRLQTDGLKAHATFTYGAPRCFNPAAAKAFKQRLYRFVNHSDVVPHVPPPGVFINRYEHVGKLVHLLANGEIDETADDWEEMMERVAELSRGATAKALAGPLDDHKIASYVAKIARAIDGE